MEDNYKRPPIVVVLGHVDHGKTTLLDFIRKTKVAEREAGGITQSINISVVELEGGRKITFIDTPGHAAFKNMRSRGAKVADLALLVVATDDGVKPQTLEALEIIREEKIPFIVVGTKIDLPNSSLEKISFQLEKEGVKFEGRGGETPLIGCSARTGEGIDELLEMILLISEVEDIKASLTAPFEAVVVETGKDKRGVTCVGILRDGVIRLGDELIADSERIRIRALFNHQAQACREIFPGEPFLILGFDTPPPVGSVLRKDVPLKLRLGTEKESPSASSDDSFLPLVFKAETANALEAIIANLPKKNILVVSKGVGEVTESDVFLAKTAAAKILAFNTKVSQNVERLAESEGVEIKNFNVIYQLLDYIENLLEERKEIVGSAQILAIFPYEDKKVAGVKITKGKILKGERLFLFRNDQKIGEVKIVSMRKGKKDIEEAYEQEECGILFIPQLDFKVGDVLLSVRK